jgi:hypothetical protein
MAARSNLAARSRARIFAGTAIVAVVLLGVGDTAMAKGPESATVAGPGIDQPVELIDAANPDLVSRLMEQTGLWFGRGDLPRPIEEPLGDLGPALTLTWVNSGPPGHSVEVRTIRQLLYLYAEGGPVIHTPDQGGLAGWGPGVIGWFAAPGRLRETLGELGVPVASPPVGAGARSGVVVPSSRQPESGPPLGYAAVAGLVVAVGVATSTWRLVRVRPERPRPTGTVRVGGCLGGSSLPQPGSGPARPTQVVCGRAAVERDRTV